MGDGTKVVLVRENTEALKLGVKADWSVLNVGGRAVTEKTCLDQLKQAKTSNGGFSVTFSGLSEADISEIKARRESEEEAKNEEDPFATGAKIVSKSGKKGHVRRSSNTGWVGVQYEGEQKVVLVKKDQLEE